MSQCNGKYWEEMNKIMLIRNSGETNEPTEVQRVKSGQVINQMIDRVSMDPKSYDKHLIIQLYIYKNNTLKIKLKQRLVDYKENYVFFLGLRCFINIQENDFFL